MSPDGQCAVICSMSPSELYQNLQQSKIYEPVVGDQNSRQWLVQSIGGEAFELTLDQQADLQISVSLVITATEVINISVFREIAELLGERGCSLIAAKPIGGRQMRLVVGRKIAAKYLAKLADLETEMAIVDLASAAVLSLLQRVAEAASLDFVDLSMFAGIDLDQFEIVELLHRRFFEFTSWEEMCAAARDTMDDRAAADEVVRQLLAFKEFERKNPHINLAEVVQFVVVAAADAQSITMPGPLEIN